MLPAFQRLRVRQKRMRGRKWAAYSVAGEGAWLAVWGMHYTEAADGIQDRRDEWMEMVEAQMAAEPPDSAFAVIH